jgi:hypothetical protein
MAFFQAYYDASGSQSSPDGGLAVVGLVATETKWLRWERHWEKILRDFGVTAHHHKDFTVSAPRSDFASWESDKEKRADYIAALIRAIARGMNKGFAVVIAPGVLQQVNREVELPFGENGYALAANVCRRYAEMWLRKKHPTAQLHHFFEDGDTGQGVLQDVAALIEVIGTLRSPLTIVPKVDSQGKRLRQFEAADLVAWEARRGVLDALSPPRLPRQSLVAIAKRLPLAGTTLTAERVLAICRKRPDLYPPRR